MLQPHASDAGATAVDARTRAAFGFEWLRYPVTSFGEDAVTLYGLTGIEPRFYDQVQFRNLFSHEPTPADVASTETPFFEGKKVLEAGCGMGKYVNVVATRGARLAVGLDASDAVLRAHQLNRKHDNALILQGDIFHPPLRGNFDFAYSVGVLHHTPAPRRAFMSVASLVRPDGELAVWLYPHSMRPAPQLLEFWHERIARPLTSRLPHETLERLCAQLGRLSAYKTRLLNRGGAGRRLLARLINLVAVGEHVDPEIAAFLNFDWYSPPYRSRHTVAELEEWYRTAEFATPRSLPVQVSAIGRKMHGG
jgi:SAM-dependent methyltransferase